MTKNKTGHKLSHTILIIVFLLVDFACLIYLILRGTNIAIFNPKGLIAGEQMNLMLLIIGIIVTVAIPTVILLFIFAYKYRESNPKAAYDPNTRYGKGLDAIMWLIPSVFMVVLAVILWGATHKLEPNKVITSENKPIKVQAIAHRWKWVFLYPDQKIATVNFVQFPKDTPVTFELTADEAPMSAFWIPNLGGMLYAMTSHVNQLNLIGDTEGDYEGRPGEINGHGFADMKFTARVSTQREFDRWVQEVKDSPQTLDDATYKELVKPSENNITEYYSSYPSDLYDKVLMKYTGQTGGHSQH